MLGAPSTRSTLGHSSPSPAESLVVLGLIAASLLPFFYLGSANAVVFAGMVLAFGRWIRRPSPLFGPALYCLLQFAVVAQPFVRDPSINSVPIVLYLLVSPWIAPWREINPWLRMGRADAVVLLLSVVTMIGSALALLWWVRTFHPDIRDLVTRVATLRGWLIGIAVLGVLANALCEELVFRGVVWHGLQHALPGRGVAWLGQAVIFGLSHYRGFPRGVSGMCLAAAYGLALGAIRARSGGLAWPTATHVAADATILWILIHEP